MADESVELEIELKDGISKPAKRASRALSKLADDAQRAQTRMLKRNLREGTAGNKRFLNNQFAGAKKSALIAKRSAQIRELEGSSWSKLGRGISNFAGGVGYAAAMLAPFGVAAGGVSYSAFHMGEKLIESARSAGQLRFALGQLTHTDGRKELEEITKTAVDLGLGAEEAAHSYATLLKQGFSAPDAKKWIKFGADMQALGSSSDEVQGLLVQMSQMKGKGKVEQSDLRVMADNGLNLGYVREALAEKLGKTVPEVMKMQEAGAITADMGFEAIEKAILRKMNTSRAGEAAEKYVQSFAGSMSKGEAELGRVGLGLGAAFERGFADAARDAEILKKKGFTGYGADVGLGGFMKQMENSPALEKLGVFVERLGENFAKMLPSILAVGEAFFAGFTGGAIGDAFDPAMIAGFAAVLRDDVAPAMKNVGSLIGTISKWTLYMTAGFAYAGVMMTSAIETVRSGVVNLVTDFTDLGGRIIDGFIEGMTAGWTRTKEAVTGWAGGVVSWAEVAFDINSPSKEFAKLGKYSTQGFQMGLDSLTPQLPTADAMAPAPGSLMGGGSPISMQIEINVNGTSDPAETARMVRIEFESMLSASFGRFAEGIA